MEVGRMKERYIGLCMAAGGIITGVDSVLGTVRGGKAKFVLIASDASDRTKKQLTDKCTYYNVRYCIGEYDSAAIAQMLGKRSLCSAAAFTGRGPWAKVMHAFADAEAQEDSSSVKECCDDRKDDC